VNPGGFTSGEGNRSEHMKTLITGMMILAGLVASSCLGQGTNSAATAPDIGRLTNGMPYAEFQTAIGMAGENMPQPSPIEAHCLFDLDGKFIVAAVRTEPKPAVVVQFWVREDNMTRQQRREKRHEATRTAVVRPHRIQTNAVPNKASEPIGATAPQVQR